MTKVLYLEDSYLKNFQTTVKTVGGIEGKHFVILEETAFYPMGGGQLNDTGVLTTASGETYEVVDVRKGELNGSKGILHEVNKEGLKEGDEVQGAINWERRYALMRMHTASHALCAIVHQKSGALITGHQLYPEKARIDFSLETFDKEKLTDYVEECNQKMAEGADVKFSQMSREEAIKDPALMKLANVLPPEVKELRIVEIVGIDKQADGGTHVKNTTECGKIVIQKFENKGKGRKRITIELT